ncbi:RimK family alpha-L-glutamate ligase [Burkholderia sp. WAC0059]|uniref:ATP-grasp domain-containing protein n=1 Tax=Burkholderia sp. WAC0059 TaxID=2066022 RepID=UPI000C7F537E|nr:RimK family alpha-L-glutamate ligase [Burkholderia sp. WAC0059]PLZ01400.1 RimK family alpha-L-glutamate ligase [Burkholderia sp. WAC0059]
MNTPHADVARGQEPIAYRPLGLATLLRQAAAGSDLTPVGEQLLDYSKTHGNPQVLLDLALVLELKYEKASALAVQELAIRTCRHYRLKAAQTSTPPVRVLALKAPGDLMTNTPFECLVEQSDFQVEALYVDGRLPEPTALPDHDVVLVTPCALDANVEALARIDRLLEGTSRRVLNHPRGIAKTTREAAWALLGHVPGICMAHTVRVGRARLLAAAAGEWSLADAVGSDFPFIVRPVGSHAGRGLERLADREALKAYVDQAEAAEFYVAPFIDYSGADGLFRKYRIVLIDGKPYVCHMGISRHWMVHYPYPEMLEHPERREEEARFMASFDTKFAVRHRDALRSIADLTGLDYIGFDCAETNDGRLLIFEVATAMIVHDMDDPGPFPYKLAQMKRVFSAFCDMLQRAARPAANPSQ